MESEENTQVATRMTSGNSEEVDNSVGMEREDAGMRRGRGTDFSQALISQVEAARECAKDTIRKFVRIPVEVETIGGKPLVFSVWASEEKPVHRRRTQQSDVPREFPCEHCKKVFDSGRKLMLHSKSHDRVHETEQVAHSCAVCGKSFDEKRKLTLHFRYHKVSKSKESTPGG